MKMFWSAAFLIEREGVQGLAGALVGDVEQHLHRLSALDDAVAVALRAVVDHLPVEGEGRPGQLDEVDLRHQLSAGSAPWSSKNFTVTSSRRAVRSLGIFTGTFQVASRQASARRRGTRGGRGTAFSLSVQARTRASGSVPLFSAVTSRSKVSPAVICLSWPGLSEATSCGVLGVAPGRPVDAQGGDGVVDPLLLLRLALGDEGLARPRASCSRWTKGALSTKSRAKRTSKSSFTSSWASASSWSSRSSSSLPGSASAGAASSSCRLAALVGAGQLGALASSTFSLSGRGVLLLRVLLEVLDRRRRASPCPARPRAS